jgi:hypothetical protein
MGKKLRAIIPFRSTPRDIRREYISTGLKHQNSQPKRKWYSLNSILNRLSSPGTSRDGTASTIVDTLWKMVQLISL